MVKAASVVMIEEGEEDTVQPSRMLGIMMGGGGNLGWDD